MRSRPFLLFSTLSNPPLRGRFLAVGGRNVHYHVLGRGPPVLLLHGNGSLGEEILSSFRRFDGVTWIAPDRPGFGLSGPLDQGREDPASVAAWTLALIDALSLDRPTLVAHSIAAGAALCLAARQPDRIGRLVLLAPFCRPTPHRWMLGLRLAVAPAVGRPVRRYLLPAVLPLFRQRILEGMLDPNEVPAWLRRFPIEHAARGPSIRAMAAELRRFNSGMTQALAGRRIAVPTTAVFGAADTTAPAHWHEPWLRRHAPNLSVIRLPGVGHAVHHAEPERVFRVIA